MGNEIVRVQKGFFEEGLGGLKPLRMQDVADVIGVHVATVSRAAADKYIDTPRGVYPLKFFFTGGLETTSGTKQARQRTAGGTGGGLGRDGHNGHRCLHRRVRGKLPEARAD